MLKASRTYVVALALLGALALVVAGCGNSVPSNGVAKVGDTVITKTEFQHWLAAAAHQQAASAPGQAVVVPDPPNFTNCVATKAKQPVPKGTPKPKTSDLKSQCQQEYSGLRDQTMQFLISAQWLLKEADKRKIKVSDAEVQKSFQDQKKQSFPKESDYQAFLKTSGRTEADLLFQVKLSLLTNQIQQKVVAGKGNVSQSEVTSYYNKNKQRFAQPQTRDLLVVLTKKQSDAQAAKKAIDSGQSWSKVAKKYSTDQASKSQGGKLLGVSKGQQEKAFDTAIFSAKIGQVEGPVKTQFGYYVFRVTKNHPASQQTLAQASATIRNILRSQKQQGALNSFVKDFQKHYKDETNCAKGFVVQSCKNAPKQKSQTPASGASPQGASPQGAPQQGTPQQVPPGAGGATPQQVPPGAGGGTPQQVPPGAGGGTPQQVPPSSGGTPPGG
ncbi:MAG: peptidyl-prolyl cis-trans isomerase [Thermoleophilaceae bacterium]